MLSLHHKIAHCLQFHLVQGFVQHVDSLPVVHEGGFVAVDNQIGDIFQVEAHFGDGVIQFIGNGNPGHQPVIGI